MTTFLDRRTQTAESFDSGGDRDAGPLLVRLPRTPGRKDAEYMHLFGGPVDVEAHVSHALAERPTSTSERVNVSELAERVRKLEEEVETLKQLLL